MDERKRELMNDLDSYLSSRLKKRSADDDDFYSFKKKKVETVESAESSVVEVQGENLVEEYTDEGPGFFKSLWTSLVGERDSDADAKKELKEEVLEVKQEESHVKQDIHDLAQISLEILRNTPKDWVKDFKETSKFAQFKDILRRHQVIK